VSPEGDVLVPEGDVLVPEGDCDEPDCDEPDCDELDWDAPELDEPDVDVSPAVAEGDWLGVEVPVSPDDVPVEGAAAVCCRTADRDVCGAL
jgi:hypothetical protein